LCDSSDGKGFNLEEFVVFPRMVCRMDAKIVPPN
jgi:hypothetical protein